MTREMNLELWLAAQVLQLHRDLSRRELLLRRFQPRLHPEALRLQGTALDMMCNAWKRSVRGLTVVRLNRLHALLCMPACRVRNAHLQDSSFWIDPRFSSVYVLIFPLVRSNSCTMDFTVSIYDLVRRSLRRMRRQPSQRGTAAGSLTLCESFHLIRECLSAVADFEQALSGS